MLVERISTPSVLQLPKISQNVSLKSLLESAGHDALFNVILRYLKVSTSSQ